MYTEKLLFHQSLCCTMTSQWLDSDYVVTVVNCQQNGDYTAIGSSVTVLPAVNNSDYYTLTVQSPWSHFAYLVTDGIGVVINEPIHTQDYFLMNCYSRLNNLFFVVLIIYYDSKQTKIVTRFYFILGTRLQGQHFKSLLLMWKYDAFQEHPVSQ